MNRTHQTDSDRTILTITSDRASNILDFLLLILILQGRIYLHNTINFPY